MTDDMVGPDRMVPCRACEGHGFHVQKRGPTSSPHATCDVVVFDCGLCDGTGETTLDEAQRWDTRRSA